MSLKECSPSDDFFFNAAEWSNLKSDNRLLEFSADGDVTTPELVVITWVFVENDTNDSLFAKLDVVKADIEVTDLLTATEDRDAHDKG